MDPEEHRRSAMECLKAAEKLEEPEGKTLFLGMAHAWVRLAECVENNPALLGEIASTVPTASPERAAVQQQQQQPQPTPQPSEETEVAFE